NATVTVIPEVKYHFKLGISDVGDQLYDSAIFLEANSLRSTGSKKTLAQKINTIKGQLSVDFNIKFEIDSDKIISNNSYKLLDDIIEQLLKHDDLKIEIIGHTDDTGTFDHNELLSLKRAKAVSDYLIFKNVDTSRIRTKGVGATQPKSNLKSENRRVEIVFIKQSN
ncbi:MAG: OmpA family protein, partial [Flavobacteriaceae bacterium]|nr:OmpA family protein [Flavobacteriaceae bacterium]